MSGSGIGYFREMGVPAPRSVHARLIINGQFNGIYALTEQIDGRFTRENFDDGTGNLYKEIWPITNSGVPMPAEPLQNALKRTKMKIQHLISSNNLHKRLSDADGTTRQDCCVNG